MRPIVIKVDTGSSWLLWHILLLSIRAELLALLLMLSLVIFRILLLYLISSAIDFSLSGLKFLIKQTFLLVLQYRSWIIILYSGRWYIISSVIVVGILKVSCCCCLLTILKLLAGTLSLVLRLLLFRIQSVSMWTISFSSRSSSTVFMFHPWSPLTKGTLTESAIKEGGGLDNSLPWTRTKTPSNSTRRKSSSSQQARTN